MKGGIKSYLKDELAQEELKMIYRSYDVIGDIAVLRVREGSKRFIPLIAKAILLMHKNVKSIWCQIGPIVGDLRLRELTWVAGEKRAETIHKEHGCKFKVDIEKCYFSPRLSYERMRIVQQVKPSEVVVNMFAGVGTYSILIAKHTKVDVIYSIDINLDAVNYMHENVKLNKVEGKVIPIEGDARAVIERGLKGVADRVLMPLPERAYEFLDCALLTLKPSGGIIHYYDFEHARKDEDPVEKVRNKVSKRLRELNVDFEVISSKVVRGVGPNWYQVVLDILVKPKR